MRNCFTSFRDVAVGLRLFGVGLLGVGPFIALHQAAAQTVLIDRVVAVVNREVITQSELDEVEYSLKKTKETGPDEARSSRAFQRDLLSQLIEKKMTLQEAKKRGVRLSDQELEMALNDIQERNRFPSREALKRAIAQESVSWEQYVKDLEDQLTVLKLMNREVDAQILLTEEEIQAYYTSHPEQFRFPDQLRLKQILIRIPQKASNEELESSRQKADQAFSDLKGGKAFDRLVQEYSEGPEKRDGGDLGYFQKGDLTPEIDEAVFGLEEGATTPVIQSQLGFHIFKVQEKKQAQLRPLEKVRREIEERLTADQREALRRKWLDELWSRSFVEVK